MKEHLMKSKEDMKDLADAIESGDLKDTGAEIIEYDTGAVAFTAMKQGKCDFVVIDELPAKKLVG